MIKLVTGSTGTLHVTAADDGGLHAALAGSAGLVVFDIGSKFGATMSDATNIRIADGEGLIDGRHFRIEPGTLHTLSTSAGVDGYNRRDLIVLHYVNSGGLESLEMEVLEGAFSSDAASDPSYMSGSILEGATEAYFPMYRLSRSGINIPTVEELFTAYNPADKTPADHTHKEIKNNLSITGNLTVSGTITANKVIGAVFA